MRVVIIAPNAEPSIKIIANSTDDVRGVIDGVEVRFRIDTIYGNEIIGILRKPVKRDYKLNRPII